MSGHRYVFQQSWALDAPGSKTHFYNEMYWRQTVPSNDSTARLTAACFPRVVGSLT